MTLLRDPATDQFAVLQDAGTTNTTRERAREELVTGHLPLVARCARRFRDRGEPWEDLLQVGTVGLIHAVDRFDPSRGVAFSSFAIPTILGELKRHFRDRGWALRVPRRMQELRLELAAASAELSQDLGRSPTPRELAERVGCSVEEVVEGLDAVHAYAALSLDATDPLAEDPVLAGAALGVADHGLEEVELRATLRPLLDTLDPESRAILVLRFFRNLSQARIAEELGLTQMAVSRSLGRTLRRLRSALEE